MHNPDGEVWIDFGPTDDVRGGETLASAAAQGTQHRPSRGDAPGTGADPSHQAMLGLYKAIDRRDVLTMSELDRRRVR
jgi:hypothetical protein